MTADAEGKTFEWDAANRLRAIHYASGNRTELAYDGFNRRVSITEKSPGTSAILQPAGVAYRSFDTAPMFLPAGSYVLKINGVAGDGKGEQQVRGNVALVDSVGVVGATVLNGSFESPAVIGDQPSPSGAAWTFVGSAGISHTGSPYTTGNPSLPDGNQVAFIKGVGAISQAITLNNGGMCVLSLKAAQSNADSLQQLSVTLESSTPYAIVKKCIWNGNAIAEERDVNNNTTKRFIRKVSSVLEPPTLAFTITREITSAASEKSPMRSVLSKANTTMMFGAIRSSLPVI